MQNPRQNYGPAYGQMPPVPSRPRTEMAPSMITRADMEAFARRPGPGPMVPNPQQAGPSQQQIQQQQAAQETARIRRDDAKMRSQKPVDKNMPGGLEDIVMGDGVERYKSMREMERRLDALMMRKRLDVQDPVYRDSKQTGTMRIWISNTVANQSWQSDTMDVNTFDFNSGVEPTFRVKIEGRLLKDARNKSEEQKKQDGDMVDEEEDQDTTTDGERASKRQKMSPRPPSATTRRKLAHCFGSINIAFDRPMPDNTNEIEWKRPEGQHPGQNVELSKEADFDKLEFERKGDENMNVTIRMVKDEQPERYRLSTKLAELIDTEEADRQTVLMGIWEYIKLAQVRMDEDKRHIYCDSRLNDLFNRESIYFPHLPSMISEHLFDPPPIELTYTIRVDKAFHDDPTPTIYDISVPIPQTTRSLPIDTAVLKKITAIDDSLALLVSKITASQAKHNFLQSLATDPANFIKRWTSSQKRDLEVITGKGAWGDEDWQGAEWRKGGESGVWGSREAWESVGTYLSKAAR